jgi:hypothetical protein
MRFFLFFMFLFLYGKTQTFVRGKVIDAQTQSGIAFVSIGVPGKAIGTVSDEAGNFHISINDYSEKDSLRFMAIGYQPISVALLEFKPNEANSIALAASAVELEEVVVKPGKLKYKKLGVKTYSKNNCTGFADVGNNWKGSEAAVLFHNDREIKLEYFAFYIIQNKYSDSLHFRLKFYKKTGNNYVGPLIANKAVIFKIGTTKGEVKIPLNEFNIRLKEDFFVSLECLENELDIRKFCYSGSLKVPSYYKVKAFSKWHSTRGTNNGGGGADFNLMVSYSPK